MTRAVDVRVVTVLRLILNVRRVDRNATVALFRRRIDLIEGLDLRAALGSQNHGNGRGESRLAVVHVPNGANIHVRLSAFELLLAHIPLPPAARVALAACARSDAYDAGWYCPRALPTISCVIFSGTTW